MTMDRTHGRDLAVLLSLTAVVAMGLAYLLIFIVLRDPGMTDKLMNGATPAGTDVGGIRVTAVGAVLAALGAWVAAVASRNLIPVILVMLASMPLAPLGVFVLALAF
ncbi:hypothetical protein [Arthrobacter sp. SLBN-53]|uniref:hypothetical protein n=1 Tax=Arthrobacter sp. SLBN-53 TaxID=2768412 RepID=UPI00114F08BC|nr:hypothetical protein [Arthrobacter sp. SLBN-53]